MNEQLLKDLVATAQADNYSWETIIPKFPELVDFDEQVLKDYVATAEQDDYDYTKINAKFPEFFQSDQTSKTNEKEPVEKEDELESNIKKFKDIELNSFDNIEEQDLIPVLEEKYGDDYKFEEQIGQSGYMYDQIYVTDKTTGQGKSIRLNTEYNRNKGQGNDKAYETFISFVNENTSANLKSLVTENPIDIVLESNIDYQDRKSYSHKVPENSIKLNINKDNEESYKKAEEYRAKDVNPLKSVNNENAKDVLPKLLDIDASLIKNHSDFVDNIASSYSFTPMTVGSDSDLIVIPRNIDGKDFSYLSMPGTYSKEISDKGYIIVDPSKVFDDKASEAYMNIIATDEANKDLKIFDGDSNAQKGFVDSQLNALFYSNLNENEARVYKFKNSINSLRAKQQSLLNSGNIEEAKKYETFINEADKDLQNVKKELNLGEKIYDNKTGTLIDITKATEEQKLGDKEITEKAKSILNFEQRPTVDYLEDLRRKKFYELKGIYSEMSDLSGDLEASSIGDGFSMSERSKADYAKYISYFNKTGVVPKGLKKILSEVENTRSDGNSIALAKKHDALIDDIAVLNRALKLNVNAMTAEEKPFYDYTQIIGEFVGTENWSEVGDFIGAGKNPEMLAETTRAVIVASGLKIDPDVLKNDVVEKSFGEELVGEAPGLLKMVAAFALAETIPGVAPTLKYLRGPFGQLMKNSFRGGSSTVFNGTVDFITHGSTEMIKMNIANNFLEEVGEEKMPIEHGFFFGVGNAMTQKISKKLLTSYIPGASEIIRAFSTIPGVKTVAGATVAGTIPTTISKAISAGEVLVGDWNDPQEKDKLDEIYKNLTSGRAWAKEIIQFGLLHIGGRPVKSIERLVKGMDTNSGVVRKANKTLGLSGVNDYAAIEKAFKSKTEGKELSPKELSELEAAKGIAEMNKDVSDAQTWMSERDNKMKSTQTQIEIIGRKLVTNEKLTVKEMELLDNLKTEGIKGKNNTNRNTSLIIADAMGIDPRSFQFNQLNALINQGQVTGMQARKISDPSIRKSFVEDRQKEFEVAKEIATVENQIEQIKLDNETAKSDGVPIERRAEVMTEKSLLDGKLNTLKAEQQELAGKQQENIGKMKEVESVDYKSDLDFTRSIAESFGVKEVVEITSADEWKKTFKNNQKSDALYSPKENKIYINKQRILGGGGEIGSGATSAASHELFHAFLKNSLKGEQGREIIDSFVESLPEHYQKLINRRFTDQYTKDKSTDALYEEKLNIFLDALKLNQVKQIKGVKERISNIFNKELGLSTGEDINRVINRFYSQAKDKKLDQGLLDLFGKESERQIDAETPDYFKSKTEERSFSEDVDKTLGIEKVTEQEYKKAKKDFENGKISKMPDPVGSIKNLTKAEWDAGRVKDGVDLVNSGKFDAIIIEGTGKDKMRISGDKIIIQGEEFSKNQFILDVRDKINDVVRSWDPQNIKGEKAGLAGWIFNPLNLNNKKLDVFKTYEKKALSDKAGRGEGQAELTLRVERPAEPFGAGRTNSLGMLSPESRLELSNEIKNKITDEGKYPFVPETMDAYLGTFDNLIKDIPYIAARELKNDLTIFGKEVLKDPNFSFREEAIVDPKKNLNIPEAKVAQRWMMSGGINPNFAKAIDLMPYNNVPVLREYAYKGNTTERIKHPKSRKGDNYINISASSGKINQPTGIDRNIKRDFFTKTDQRIGNDFLWTKNNFSEEYFLGKIGIKDKKKEASFTQRESEAQTLKGVLRYITKEMTLKAFSERAQELGLSNQVNDLRSAKNVYSASQTAIRDFDMPKQKDFLENKLSDIAQDFKVNYAGVPDRKQIRSVVKKYLLDDFYTTKDKNDIIDALSKGLKKAEASVEYNKKVFSDISKVDIEKFLKDHTKEIIEGDFERINEDYLGLKRGELQEVSIDPEVQKARRLRDEAAWSDYMENSTDKLKAAEVLASLNEQYTNSSTIGGKRHVYWGGTANWRAGLNNVINKYGINLEKTTLTQGDKKVKVRKYGGSNFHNSETFIKQAGLKSNSKLSDYKSGEVKELVEEYDRVALEARKFLEAQLLSETQAFMNGEITTTKSGVSPEAQMGIAMMALKNSMGSVLRLAAPVRGIYIPLKGEKLITTNSRKYIDPRDGKSKSEKLLTWEHNKSAEKMLLDLLKVYSNKDNLKTIEGTNKIKLNQKGKTELEAAYEDFYVNIIPYKMDGVLRRTGYEVLSPIEGTRYYNESSMHDPNMRSIYNFKTGKVEGEAWAKSAELAINPKLAKDNLKSDPVFAASESNTRTNVDFLNHAKNNDRALELARKPNKKPKKIRVFDFDDTLARSKSLVFYTKKDGTRGKLTAEQFAEQGASLISKGAVMDFTDFNIVREGKKGPMFEVAEKIRDARGTDDVFVLTARAPEARDAIHKFLKSEGLDIPIENITGLGNSTGEAKAQWLVSKAAEGYNDFFFADDAIANVKAVKEALEPLDIKSKTQQVFASNSENRSLEFNKLLEESTGIEYYKEYSAAKAKTIGASKGKFKFFIPHSAEDFVGLIYPTLTKGKLGDKQMAWYKENLLNPYSRAMDNLSRDRVQLLTDFKALKKELNVPKDLRKEAKTGFTKEQAVRVYLFEKAGFGKELDKTLSQTDKADLLKVVESDATLKTFAEQIFNVTKGDGYSKPGENWLVGTITTDLLDLINTGKRSKYLEEWQNNVDQIYSKQNLNKLEAIYGTKYREALENILARMKAGKNRLAGGNRLSNQMLDYVNGSNAAIMFFNVRSAALQMISNINYVNWSFNNPLKAGAAVANQPQYWKDVTKLLNSDYLMDRRNGLKLNINESEIADAASTSKNKFKAGIQYILQKGYLPTQYADSFAIATGGATYYRNRINDLIKNEGKTLAEAEKQAMIEFRQKSEESQQSADPSRISSQQASDAGRLILMFANTPMQYARMQKRAFQDLANGRGDAKTNVSKIIYYGFVQNMLFNGLQNALFKIAADEDQTFENNSKAVNRTFNGMLDGLLRGIGIGGAAVSVGKNFLLDVYERSNRKRPEYVDAAWKLTQFSPPISSKISKIKSAAYPFDNKKMREEIYSKGFSLDNPATMSGARVISATTNVPLDRLLQKYDNIDAALAEDTETWQSIAMMAGWPEWQIKAKPEAGPMTEEQKEERKLNRYEEKYKAADGSTDFETLKKLNKEQQIKMLKDLGYGSQDLRKAKKEADRIELIIEANKEQ